MNLYSLVTGAVSAINPMRRAKIAVAQGYTTNADGTRVPVYLPPRHVLAQVQELSSMDLQATDGLNLQGETKSIYLQGDWTGVVRADGRGGDVIQFDDGTVWLVNKIAENWLGRKGWVKVIATRQMDGALP